MFRSKLIKGFKLGSIFSLLTPSEDVISGETKTERTTKITTNETGWERLKRMFQLNEFEELSPELNSVVQVGLMSVFVGGLYGGILSSRSAYMDFMNNNQATAFKNHFEAKKKLQDKVTLSFGKGAFRWGWRLAVFSTSYIGISTTISVYRGEQGILEHVVAGAATGFIYKLPVGPRAWVVGSGLGLVLGTIAGTLTYGLLSLSGVSMEEVRYWQYKWKEERDNSWKKAMREHMKAEESLFLKEDNPDGPKGLDNVPDDKT